MAVRISLTVLAVVYLLLNRKGCSATLAHVGSHMKKIITVYEHQVTWLDAYRKCESLPNGYIAIADKPGPILEYVRHVLFTSNVLQGQDLWMGFVKPELKWLRSDTCDEFDGSLSPQHSIPDRINECGLMDMTSDTDGMEWKAARCDETRPFVCFQETDIEITYEQLPGLKILYPMPGWSLSSVRIAIDYCFHQLEKHFHFAGFQYNEYDRKCVWYTGYMKDFPITLYTDDAAGANITIRIKSESDEVIISNENIPSGNLQFSSTSNTMPCANVLTTVSTSTPVTMESSTTTTETTTVPATLSDINVVSPSSDINVVSPSSDINVVSPSSDINVVSPSSDINVVSPSSDINVVSPSSDINVVSPSSDINLVSPSSDINVVSPSSDINVVSPSSDINVVSPSSDMNVVSPSSDIDVVSPSSATYTSSSMPVTSTEGYKENTEQNMGACSEMERSLNDSNCYCSKLPPAVTKEKLQQLIADIQKENIVDIKETSYFKRKLSSAPDERTSSQAIGLAGVAIIVSVVVVIVSSDISYVISIMKECFKV